ncbi:hypothetical protein ACTMTJ_44615 [Phytohabitans sp. LJ34]|uniref:hypothetical protein n=1 Tax=Phytohabitans sp. LJ34 TaxID=3452217 RepID=UPI003F89E2C0
MRRTWTVALFEHEQPDARAQRATRRLVDEWNSEQTPALTTLPGPDWMPTSWRATFDEAARDRVESLRARLVAAHDSDGVEYHFAWRDHVEEEDYASADFIGLLGAEPDLSFRFLVNEQTAFTPAPPCPTCGAQGPLDVAQDEPLVIDRKLLDRALADLERPAPGGWDAVGLPYGRLLVSHRLLATLRERHARGHRTSPVIDAATGEPADELVQLSADRAVLVPCPEHTRVDGGGICPTCGTSHGTLDGYFWIRDDWLDDDEVISQHPSRAAVLSLSRRLLEAVRSSAPNGVRRNGVTMVCRHRAGGDRRSNPTR